MIARSQIGAATRIASWLLLASALLVGMIRLFEPFILSLGTPDGSIRVPGGAIIAPRSAEADPFAATGWTVWTFSLATLLALPLSWALLTFYKRTVIKRMGGRANESRSPAPASQSHNHQQATNRAISITDEVRKAPQSIEASRLFSELKVSPWTTVAVYSAAGLGFAVVTALLVLIAGGTRISSTRMLVLTWLYSWPAAIAVYLVVGATRWSKLVVISAYFANYLIISTIAIAISPNLRFGQTLVLWLITNLFPTILLIIFINHRVRAVGPLVLLLMIVAVFGALVAPFLLFSRHTPSLTRMVAGLLGATLGITAAQVFGFALFGAVGWFNLQYVRRLYQAKKLSDQAILLGAVWLQFAIFWYAILAFAGYAWVLTAIPAFAVYVLLLRAGFALRNRRMVSSIHRRRLLVLRVFALGKRSERLFEVVSNRWRHVGSIAQIAGPDLVEATVQPHEFLDFMSGKLTRRFIDGEESLARSWSEADLGRDGDGRFRVNDFFCYDDTWKLVLDRLIADANAVLMDLRGFSARNSGCAFEIEQLINVFPLRHTVFIVDETTDELALNAILKEVSQRIPEASPNKESLQLCAVRFGRAAGSDLQNLFVALCNAATSA